MIFPTGSRVAGARVFTIGVALILAVTLWLAAMLVAAASETSAQQGSNTKRDEVIVLGKKRVTGTDIWVRNGDTLRVKATGRINVAGGIPEAYFGPAGSAPRSKKCLAGADPPGADIADNTYVLPGAHCYALLIRYGQGSLKQVTFEVGKSKTFRIQGLNGPSPVSLIVNDQKNAFGDNSGQWTVSLTRLRPG